MSSSDPKDNIKGVAEDGEQPLSNDDIIEVERDPTIETEATATHNNNNSIHQHTLNSPTATKDVPWDLTTSIKDGRDESIIANVEDIKNAVYFLYPDWKTRQSRFWMLLILAAIIATAGVIGDSTATVIGASTFTFTCLFCLFVCLRDNSIFLYSVLFLSPSFCN